MLMCYNNSILAYGFDIKIKIQIKQERCFVT